MDATAIAAAIRAGSTTAAATVEDALARQAEVDGELNAFTLVIADSARAQAAEVDAGTRRGPLAGVPISIKDHVWVRGLPGNSNTVYEVVCDKGSYSVSAGTFRADREGRANITLTTAMRVGQYDRIRIVRHEWDARTRKTGQTNVLTAKLS